jgi:hypothetical protein
MRKKNNNKKVISDDNKVAVNEGHQHRVAAFKGSLANEKRKN